MKYQFEILKTTRVNIVKLLEGLTLAQVNTIPEGFRNNILWNAGHNVVVQGMLCYGLSGNALPFSDVMRDKYKKGTVPSAFSQADLDAVLELLVTLPIKMEEDYNSGVFNEYKPYETSYGITLSTIEEAISFNNLHDGLHFGYMMAIRKLV